VRSSAIRAVGLLIAAAAAGCGSPAPPRAPDSWTALVAPLAPGREVTRGFVLAAPTRGHEHDVVFRATRAADHARVEVHVVDRARWPDARPAGAFSVDWELPRTTASRDDAAAVTDALTRAIASHPGARGPVDAVALDRGTPVTARPRALSLLGRLGTWRVFPWWLVALALVAAALRGRARLHRPDAALFVAALVARAALGAWRPFHVNGQGALWITGALHPEELRAYGPGWSELHGWLPRLVAPDTAVFATHVALGAALAPLAAVVARQLGLSPARAFLAGALVVADPVLVRIGATESYVVPILALSAGSVAALLAARDADRRRAAALTLAGALLAAQCARVHPLGWMPVAVAPLLVAAGAGLRAGAAAALAIGAATALTSGCVLADVLASVANGATASPTWMTRPAWPVLALVLAAGLHPRARRIAPAAAFAAALAAVIAETYGQSDVWRLAAVHAVALPWAPTLAALLPAAAVATGARAGALAAALAAALLVTGAPMVRSRTTDEMEFAWARAWMASRPASCRVAWVAFAGPRRTEFLPAWASRGGTVRIDAREAVNARALLDPLGCTEYVRTTACDAPDARAACAEVERALVLVPGESATFPARASHRGLPFATPTVRAQTFRVTGFRE
jgi:hypothetical protein